MIYIFTSPALMLVQRREVRIQPTVLKTSWDRNRVTITIVKVGLYRTSVRLRAKFKGQVLCDHIVDDWVIGVEDPVLAGEGEAVQTGPRPAPPCPGQQHQHQHNLTPHLHCHRVTEYQCLSPYYILCKEEMLRNDTTSRRQTN